MNTVTLLMFLLNATNTAPASAAVMFDVPAATCEAYESVNRVGDGMIIVCESRAEAEHDLRGGSCTVNPTTPVLSNGAISYVCKND